MSAKTRTQPGKALRSIVTLDTGSSKQQPTKEKKLKSMLKTKIKPEAPQKQVRYQTSASTTELKPQLEPENEVKIVKHEVAMISPSPIFGKRCESYIQLHSVREPDEKRVRSCSGYGQIRSLATVHAKSVEHLHHLPVLASWLPRQKSPIGVNRITPKIKPKPAKKKCVKHQKQQLLESGGTGVEQMRQNKPQNLPKTKSVSKKPPRQFQYKTIEDKSPSRVQSVDRLVRSNIKKNLELKRRREQQEKELKQMIMKRQKDALSEVQVESKKIIGKFKEKGRNGQELIPRSNSRTSSLERKRKQTVSVTSMDQFKKSQDSKRKKSPESLGRDNKKIKTSICVNDVLSKPLQKLINYRNQENQQPLPQIQIINTERQQKSASLNKLVQSQKKNWISKKREVLLEKIQEQKRILKNLGNLNKITIKTRQHQFNNNYATPRRSSPKIKKANRHSSQSKTKHDHQDNVAADYDQFSIFEILTTAAIKIQRAYRKHMQFLKQSKKEKKRNFSFCGGTVDTVQNESKPLVHQSFRHQTAEFVQQLAQEETILMLSGEGLPESLQSSVQPSIMTESPSKVYSNYKNSPNKKTQTSPPKTDEADTSFKHNQSKLSLDAGSSSKQVEDSIAQISQQAGGTDKIINQSSASIQLESFEVLTMTLTQQNYHKQILKQIISQDEKSINSSLESSSFLLQTNGSIFDRSPYHVFTATKLKELMSSGDPSILDIKAQCLKYYKKLEAGFNKRKKQESVTDSNSSNKWDEPWAAKADFDMQVILDIKKKVDRIKRKVKVQKEVSPLSVHISQTSEEIYLDISIEDDTAHQAQVDAITDYILQEMLLKQELSTMLDRFRRVEIDEMVEVSQVFAGIDTSQEAVEAYVSQIFVKIRSRGQQFLHAFFTPVFQDPLLALQKLRSKVEEVKLEETSSSILNVQLYLTLEKARENVIKEALQQIRLTQELETSNLSDLLSEADHIHNKAIFDAVNQALKMYRPYGLRGEPMPWHQKLKMNFFIFEGPKQLDDILQSVFKKIQIWSGCRGGQLYCDELIHEQTSTQHMMLYDREAQALIKQRESKENNETQTLHLQREIALGRILSLEIVENNYEWQTFDREQDEIKLELADQLLELLVGEMVQLLINK